MIINICEWLILTACQAQLAGAIEYTDCISAEEYPLQQVSWIWH